MPCWMPRLILSRTAGLPGESESLQAQLRWLKGLGSVLADAVAALETPRAIAIPATPTKSFGIIFGLELLRFGYLKFYPRLHHESVNRR